MGLNIIFQVDQVERTKVDKVSADVKRTNIGNQIRTVATAILDVIILTSPACNAVKPIEQRSNAGTVNNRKW